MQLLCSRASTTLLDRIGAVSQTQQLAMGRESSTPASLIAAALQPAHPLTISGLHPGMQVVLGCRQVGEALCALVREAVPQQLGFNHECVATSCWSYCAQFEL